jgi:hypothetical protein
LEIFDWFQGGGAMLAGLLQKNPDRKSSIFNLQSKNHEAVRKAFSDVPFQAGMEVSRLRERRKWLQP